MNLIIVSGPEATGKTAVGKKVAELLKYKYIGKDVIKEALFNAESHSTWKFSWYENKAKEQLFDSLEKCIQDNTSVVIESNFIKSDRDKLLKKINNKISVCEIFCTAKGLTSFRRFVRRNESGQRNKGHHDRRWYPKVLSQDILRIVHINWPYKAVGLSDKLLIIDSTNFSKIDYDKILEFIKTP
jgi:predicted kinase